MHRFIYKGNRLYCESTSVEQVTSSHETPFYLYSYATLIDHYMKLKRAFGSIKPLICFSMKANSNLAICKALVSKGSGLDIVSGGELYKALKINCPAERIVYASVGKKYNEIKDAIEAGILFFNVESTPELQKINEIAMSLGRRPNVALRINPDISPKTHAFIKTGARMSKFGLDFKTAREIFDNSNRYRHVKLAGIHIHIGSQIVDTGPFVKAIRRVLNFVDKAKEDIKWLNIGGGMGIIYSKEKPSTAKQFADTILPLIKKRAFKLIIEPGRFIAGNSGILVTKVLYVKHTSFGKKFAIVDAGMNDFVRPSLYGAYHEILPVNVKSKKKFRYDVVGPICENSDFLAQGRLMPEVETGDYLAVMGAGAYGFSMSSNYNSRPRPSELMVANGKVRVIRRAETYKDLIRGERY